MAKKNRDISYLEISLIFMGVLIVVFAVIATTLQLKQDAPVECPTVTTTEVECPVQAPVQLECPIQECPPCPPQTTEVITKIKSVPRTNCPEPITSPLHKLEDNEFGIDAIQKSVESIPMKELETNDPY